MKSKLKNKIHGKKKTKTNRNSKKKINNRNNNHNDIDFKKTLKRKQNGGEPTLDNFRKYMIQDIVDYLGPSLYYKRIQHDEKPIQHDEKPKTNLPEQALEITNSEKYLLLLQQRFIIELKNGLFSILQLNKSDTDKFEGSLSSTHQEENSNKAYSSYLSSKIFKKDFFQGIHNKFRILMKENKEEKEKVFIEKIQIGDEIINKIKDIKNMITGFKKYGFRKTTNMNETIKIILSNLFYYYGYNSNEISNNLTNGEKEEAKRLAEAEARRLAEAEEREKRLAEKKLIKDENLLMGLLDTKISEIDGISKETNISQIIISSIDSLTPILLKLLYIPDILILHKLLKIFIKYPQKFVKYKNSIQFDTIPNVSLELLKKIIELLEKYTEYFTNYNILTKKFKILKILNNAKLLNDILNNAKLLNKPVTPLINVNTLKSNEESFGFNEADALDTGDDIDEIDTEILELIKSLQNSKISDFLELLIDKIGISPLYILLEYTTSGDELFGLQSNFINKLFIEINNNFKIIKYEKKNENDKIYINRDFEEKIPNYNSNDITILKTTNIKKVVEILEEFNNLNNNKKQELYDNFFKKFDNKSILFNNRFRSVEYTLSKTNKFLTNDTEMNSFIEDIIEELEKLDIKTVLNIIKIVYHYYIAIPIFDNSNLGKQINAQVDNNFVRYNPSTNNPVEFGFSVANNLEALRLEREKKEAEEEARRRTTPTVLSPQNIQNIANLKQGLERMKIGTLFNTKTSRLLSGKMYLPSAKTTTGNNKERTRTSTTTITRGTSKKNPLMKIGLQIAELILELDEKSSSYERKRAILDELVSIRNRIQNMNNNAIGSKDILLDQINEALTPN